MQNLIVALIVAAAVAYSGWHILPKTGKRFLLRKLGIAETRVKQLENSGDCGSCSTCKGCPTTSTRNQ